MTKEEFLLELSNLCKCYEKDNGVQVLAALNLDLNSEEEYDFDGDTFVPVSSYANADDPNECFGCSCCNGCDENDSLDGCDCEDCGCDCSDTVSSDNVNDTSKLN